MKKTESKEDVDENAIDSTRNNDTCWLSTKNTRGKYSADKMKPEVTFNVNGETRNEVYIFSGLQQGNFDAESIYPLIE